MDKINNGVKKNEIKGRKKVTKNAGTTGNDKLEKNVLKLEEDYKQFVKEHKQLMKDHEKIMKYFAKESGKSSSERKTTR